MKIRTQLKNHYNHLLKINNNYLVYSITGQLLHLPGYYIFNIVFDIYIPFYMILIYLPCKIKQLTLKIKLTVTDTSLLYCFLDKTS